MLPEAIGASVLLGFLSFELLGLYTGGMVTAGYLAYYMDYPFRLAATVAAAIIVCLLTRLLGRFAIIYGRRRFMCAVMLGAISVWLFENFFYYSLAAIPQDIRIIGHIVPGLLANDMLKQGIFKTIAAAGVCSVLIWLVLRTGIL